MHARWCHVRVRRTFPAAPANLLFEVKELIAPFIKTIDLTRFLRLGWIVFVLSHYNPPFQQRRITSKDLSLSFRHHSRRGTDRSLMMFHIIFWSIICTGSSAFEKASFSPFNAVFWGLASCSSDSFCKLLTLSSDFIACELCSSGDISAKHAKILDKWGDNSQEQGQPRVRLHLRYLEVVDLSWSLSCWWS